MRLGGVADETGRVVTATMSGSSAEAAGIRIGDVVMSVDGLPTAGLNDAQLTEQLRGPVSSTVDVVVSHHRPWQVCNFGSVHSPSAPSCDHVCRPIA
jgi:C-terminal processing protease CtpA/Prc